MNLGITQAPSYPFNPQQWKKQATTHHY